MLLSVGAAAANDGEMFSTKSYQANDAASKQEMLWNKIIEDKTPSSFPSKLEFAGLFAEPMGPSFETVADAMPNTWVASLLLLLSQLEPNIFTLLVQFPNVNLSQMEITHSPESLKEQTLVCADSLVQLNHQQLTIFLQLFL